MKQHADKMTAEFQRVQNELEDKIKGDAARNEALDQSDALAYTAITEFDRLMFEASGIARANDILLTLFRERIIDLGREPNVQEVASVIEDASDKFGKEQETRVNRLLAAKEVIERAKAKLEKLK